MDYEDFKVRVVVFYDPKNSSERHIQSKEYTYPELCKYPVHTIMDGVFRSMDEIRIRVEDDE